MADLPVDYVVNNSQDILAIFFIGLSLIASFIAILACCDKKKQKSPSEPRTPTYKNTEESKERIAKTPAKPIDTAGNRETKSPSSAPTPTSLTAGQKTVTTATKPSVTTTATVQQSVTATTMPTATETTLQKSGKQSNSFQKKQSSVTRSVPKGQPKQIDPVKSVVKKAGSLQKPSPAVVKNGPVKEVKVVPKTVPEVAKKTDEANADNAEFKPDHTYYDIPLNMNM